MKRSINRILSPILFLFGILFMLGSHLLPKYPLVPVDADVVPFFLGGLLTFLALLLFFVKDDEPPLEELKALIHDGAESSTKGAAQTPYGEATSLPKEGEGASKSLFGLPLETGQILLFGVAILLYILLLETVGFFIMTALFIFSTTALLGYKHHLRNAIVALCVPLFFYITFTQLLKISLPSGILPF